MKKILKSILLIVLPLLFSTTSQSQVLISLIFGNALNTPKIEFGLVGGLNRSYLLNYNGSTGLNNFNLGFYFHILLKNQSYISTGVLVKSNVGATGMPTYPVGDPDFDDVFKDGVLTTKISYFYVPIMFHQRLNDNRWYVEAGIQAGLRNKAKDIFDIETNGGDVSYTRSVKSDYHNLDFGLIGGAGYKFKKQIKSMSAGILYYYGLVDVNRADDINIKNSSIYFYLKIPIGAGNKQAKEDESVVD